MRQKLIIALDVSSEEEALLLVRNLSGYAGAFKVGLQLYNSCGPEIVKKINLTGGRVFLDLKFHDIPNTAARASEAAAGLGAFMFNLHAAGGRAMLAAAAAAAREKAAAMGMPVPLVIGVTVLTSMSEQELNSIGVARPLNDQVTAMALLCREAGLDGVVASAREIPLIRKACGEDFVIVTPGVRPAWSESNDQVRIVTPALAVGLGADYLVVGRPVTSAADPAEAARRVLEEMEAVKSAE